ncbi:hypothetical protein [uncultured Shewanella sp.]|uniref:hypothetical protein n=1 Tax=uncultured Shewanella sp. TaxID=173975 RepID=UPI0026217593|nr:hypothetical protein [uncultured Shewanella sp.]
MGAFDTIGARLQNNAYVNQDALLAQSGNEKQQFQIKSEWHDTQAKIAYFKEACQVFVAEIKSLFGANIALDVIKQAQNLADTHEQWMNSTSVFEFDRENKKFDAALAKLQTECEKVGAIFKRDGDQLSIALPGEKNPLKFTIPTPDREHKLHLQYDMLNKVVNEQHQCVASHPELEGKKLYKYKLNSISNNIAAVDSAKKQLAQIEDRKQQQGQFVGGSLRDKLMSASTSASSAETEQWPSHWRHDYRHQDEYEIHGKLYKASHSVLKLAELINESIDGVNQQYSFKLKPVEGDVVPFFVNNDTGEEAKYASFKELTTPYYEYFYFKEAFDNAGICYGFEDNDLFEEFGETVTAISLSAAQEPFSTSVLAQLREDFINWKQESHFRLSSLEHSPVLDIPKQAEALIQEQTTLEDAELMSIFIDLKMRKTFAATKNDSQSLLGKVEACLRDILAAKNDKAKLDAQNKYQAALLELRALGKVIALDAGAMAKQQDPQDHRDWGVSHSFVLNAVVKQEGEPKSKLDAIEQYLNDRSNNKPTNDGRFVTFMRLRGPDYSLFNSLMSNWLEISTSASSMERLYNVIEGQLLEKNKQLDFYFAAERLYKYAQENGIELSQPSGKHLAMIQAGHSQRDDFCEENGLPKDSLYKGYIPDNLLKK